MGVNIHFKLTIILFSLIGALPFYSHNSLGQVNQLDDRISIDSDPIILTDFSEFELTVDDSYIHSTNYGSHVDFDYYGDCPINPIYDRYLYTLPVNCSDFFIKVKVNYSTNLTTGVFITYIGVAGEDHGLTAAKVWDAWAGSQAKHYINGYPNGIADDCEDEANSAGLAGTVIFQISRVDNILTTSIYNEYYTVLYLTKTWTTGVSTPVSAISINHRSGLVGAESHATFYDFYAKFTKPDNSTARFTIEFGFNAIIPFIIVGILLGAISIIRRKK